MARRPVAPAATLAVLLFVCRLLAAQPLEISDPVVPGAVPVQAVADHAVPGQGVLDGAPVDQATTDAATSTPATDAPATNAAATLDEAAFLAPLGLDHPAAAALRRDLVLARAAAVEARTLENPAASVVRVEPSGAARETDLTLSWTPPHPARRRLEIAAADASVQTARRQLTADLLTLELEAREVFARWSTAVARGARLARHRARIEALARRERRRAEAGESSGLDARRLGLAATEARVGLAQARAAAARAEGEARVWRPDLAPGVVPELPALAPPALGTPALETLARDRPAPELPGSDPVAPGPGGGLPAAVAVLEAELAAASLGREQAAWRFAMPEVSAGWQRQEEPGLSAEGPIVGVAWPLPVFDRRRAERLAADARAEAAAARLELARRRFTAEREASLAAYRLLREEALAAAADSVEAAPAVEAATRAFELGEADVTVLLETLEAALQAELAALALHEAALAAARDLARIEAPAPAVWVVAAEQPTAANLQTIDAPTSDSTTLDSPAIHTPATEPPATEPPTTEPPANELTATELPTTEEIDR